MNEHHTFFDAKAAFHRKNQDRGGRFGPIFKVLGRFEKFSFGQTLDHEIG